MKWLLLGIGALGAFIIIHQMDLKETDAAQSTSASVKTLATPEQNLLAENRQLKEHIAQLTGELARLKHTSNINSSLPTETAPHRTTPTPSELAAQENIESQMQEFNNMLGTSKDPFTKIKNNFANESVDSSWANPYQHQLENFFTESFADIHPQYIECRSTRCRITIPASDQKKSSELSQTLTQGIFNNNAGITKKIFIEPTTNDGTLNFYLARNDNINLLQ
ncbi:hypothetical protein GCM10011613_00500 [Cellvibrio zantedeschiae]|uniref:Inner membrane protein n=1 Tax=Cellvibrio zantedeschiae TaxID=1237077 RepID=A0ABQ3AMW2_9GAMM|nr:hypothetical protein [Cellvibrio zantedeschiae]GGY61053.1 hypothetical protein GCM10011613_00500 [Cellvibrio zantedeschiae]